MEKTVFDGAAFVSIDLDTGRISTPGGDSLALVSRDILALVPPGEALNRAANRWGETHGKALLERISEEDAGVDALASHLGGTLAALGMGRIQLEVRGSALMFRVVGGLSVTNSAVGAAILGGFLSGYIGAVSGHPFAVLDLGAVNGDHLFWAGNPESVEQARQSIGRGTEPFAAIDTLVTGEASC